MLRALAVMLALEKGCREGAGTGASAAREIAVGKPKAPPLTCVASRGYARAVYQRLLTMHTGALPLSDPEGAAVLSPDAHALHAIQLVDAAYTAHLGRWASQPDLAARLPGVLAGKVTDKALRCAC